MTSFRRLGVIGAAALLIAGLGVTPAAAVLDPWEPGQVVPRSDEARASTLFSTQLGRGAVVYTKPGGVWASSLPPGAGMSWEPPHQLPVPRQTVPGPVATGEGGGATVFLGGEYVQLAPGGAWGPLRTFPFYDRVHPQRALRTSDGGLVVAGSTYRPVKAAVKPSGRRWMLSPGLSLGYTLLRGLWTGADGRVHVLVTQDQHLDSRQTTSDRQGASTRPIGLYEAVLHRSGGALEWGPLRPWRTGVVGGLYDYAGFSVTTTLLSTDDGAVTVLWHEYDEATGRLVMLMRHRDPAGSWSPIRRMPVSQLSWVVSSIDDSGTTRLSYLRQLAGSDAGVDLVTREFSPEGVLSEPVRVDGPLPIVGYRLDGVAAPAAGGPTLLKWYAETGSEPVQERFYRCLPVGGCTSVGTQDARGDLLMAITPSGAGLLAGTGTVEGCVVARLCSRRLPPP